MGVILSGGIGLGYLGAPRPRGRVPEAVASKLQFCGALAIWVQSMKGSELSYWRSFETVPMRGFGIFGRPSETLVAPDSCFLRLLNRLTGA